MPAIAGPFHVLAALVTKRLPLLTLPGQKLHLLIRHPQPFAGLGLYLLFSDDALTELLHALLTLSFLALRLFATCPRFTLPRTHPGSVLLHRS